MSVFDELVGFWGGADGRRASVVGVGSDIRGDEGLGLRVIDYLKEKGLEDVLLVRAETRPENFVGLLQRFRATHILIVMSVELGGRPGEVRFIPFQSNGEKTRSRIFHETPLQTLSHFLEIRERARVKFLAVQPRSTFYGVKLTLEMDKTTRDLADVIAGSLKDSPGVIHA